MAHSLFPTNQVTMRRRQARFIGFRHAKLPLWQSVFSCEACKPCMLAAVVRARRALQQRIIDLMRQHTEACGPEPSDAQLRLFAKLVAAQERLGREVAAAKARRVRFFAAVGPARDAQ